ncbi:MAG: tetratricopeptide repeat protein [Planctomycetales bacterium]|nr:tetratricopeptide repeat protein [Planctomycetales bacterium]
MLGHSRLLCLLLVACPLMFSPVVAAAAEPWVGGVIGEAMQDRRYEDAVRAIDAVPADADAPHDYLMYLKGRAYHYLEQFPQAIAVFEEFPHRFPDSPWARRVRLAKALSFARQNNFQQAEETYRGEAEYLLSVDRKDEIAGIYLEFARNRLQPTDVRRQPDYGEALEFFRQALSLNPRPDVVTQIRLQIGKCLQKQDQWSEAAQELTALITEYPQAPELVEAKYELGRSQLQLGQFAAARQTWQDLLRQHAAGDSPVLPQAKFGIASTFQLPHAPSTSDLSRGIAALRAFLEKYPAHELASQAHLLVASTYQQAGRFEDATHALQDFLNNERYADRPELAEARYQLGHCWQRQKNYDQAIATWQDYLAEHPAHEKWTEAQRGVLETEFLAADEKRQEQQYAAARQLWLAFLAKYPLDNRAAQIMLALGQMNEAQEKWQDAIDDWRQLVSKHPGTDPAARAQLKIAATLEEKLGHYEAALEEYRKLNWSDLQAEAQRRILRLTDPRFAIHTPRIFRTHEEPFLWLDSRNIAQLTVRCYRVDLETYFRKMHLATGVESLDISLIDPDHTFTYEIPNYEVYKPSESRIPIPQPGNGDDHGGGVFVVTVTADEHEATTLVLQTDLDILVKSSRDELLVFAQNMRTGDAWPGAKVLVSDGATVLRELQTGNDGVLTTSFAELATAEDLRVFAIVNGNTASNVLGLQGLSPAQGLTQKGLIYSDRPMYRPGQIVNLKGIVRSVAEDTYRIDAGKKFELSIVDARNRSVWKQDVELSEFGSFHVNYVLPLDSALGAYRVVVTDRDKQTYQGAFQVQQFQLENIQVDVDVERSIYYRGEEIAGSIRVQYYYGAPLTNVVVNYRLADGPVQTGHTNEQGELEFRLPTNEFQETVTLPLVVEVPVHSLQVTKDFFLAAYGYSLQVSTARPVYLAGESIELQVKATDVEGNPVARDLQLKVYEKTQVGRQQGERLVATHLCRTDEKSGEVRVTQIISGGGRYVIRAEGTDRFDNPITGESYLQVSGDEDAVRLRILAAKHTFRAGDEADIEVHWREAPAVALVTYQGARILGYRLEKLQPGTNVLRVPMTADMAPNCELDISVMTDAPGVSDGKATQRSDEETGRFHNASAPFSVQRELLVSIERKDQADKPLSPGASLELILRTTDPQGQPVMSELSLAMIEQSLVDRFGNPQPPVNAMFLGTRRQSAVRSTSSIAFSYRPVTRPMNARLLADMERLGVDEAERAARSAIAEERRWFARESVSDDFSGSINGPADDAVSQLVGDHPTPGAESQSELAFEQFPAQHADPFAGRGLGEELAPMGQAGVARWDQLRSRRAGAAIDLTPQSASLSTLSLYSSVDSNARLADRKQLVVQFDSGAVQNFNIGNLGDLDVRGLAQRLENEGARILPGQVWLATGYWNPTIRTNQDGRAEVVFDLPDRSTSWRLNAVGVTKETLTGSAELALVTRKELAGELKLPLAFIDGDHAAIVATIHHRDIKAEQVRVTLSQQIGERTSRQTKTLSAAELQASGVTEVVFDSEIRLPEGARDRADWQAEYRLVVESGEHADVSERAVPVLAYGLPVFATASGTATGDATAWLDLPDTMPTQSPSLQIVIGPTVEQGLLDVLFGTRRPCEIYFAQFASASDTISSDLLAAVALQKWISRTRDAESPQHLALDQRIREAISQLVASQADDGGWSWSRSGPSNRFGTSRIVWALSAARDQGYVISPETLDKALEYLRQQITETATTDFEGRAVILQALTAAGQGDFPLANRLYRNRTSLSANGLLHLSLALAAMDRVPLAQEILGDVAQMNLDALAVLPRSSRQLRMNAWGHSSVELHALYAIALQVVQPRDQRIEREVNWLLGHRQGHRWGPDKATGPATWAASQWFAQSRFATEDYRVEVQVNGQRVDDVEFKKDSQTATLVVPANYIQANAKQRVSFRLIGRGRYSYQCVLTAFVNADQIKNVRDEWRVDRQYLAAPLRRDGRDVPRGFDVLAGSYTFFQNKTTELPVGQRTLVELRAWRHNIGAEVDDESLEYLVITEPLPSGATVIESSIQGGFERYELSPGAITFFLGSRRSFGTIQYELHGYLPGQYRVPPPVIRDAYQPERWRVGNVAQLRVLPVGEKSADAYRLTPRELLELGQWHFNRREYKEAATHLDELLTLQNLRAEYAKQATEMLLDARLAIGPASQVVRHFEVMKEKWPDQEIPYAKILQIGAAYHDMGEFERCYLIFRATIESSFLSESRVAGFLQSRDELNRSVEFMESLIRQYPPEPYVADATFDLAQEVYRMASLAAENRRLRQQKITRIDLLHRSARMLSSFVTAYPEDPAADQASFSIATAYLELDAFQQAIDACHKFIQRYPDSDDTDGFWYTIGYGHFALGEPDAALEVCRKVIEMRRKDEATGRLVPSSNHFRAIYIVGQIHHSLGQAREAIENYTRVKDKFSDAAEAIGYFTHRMIQLPEVTSVPPPADGDPQTVRLPLEFRNIAKCSLQVYRIDLMKFGLLKRDLDGIRDINLAGIRPYHEQELELGDGQDYRDRVHEIELPLRDEGAYLVVCRGEDLHTSGMVLVSPLALEVQEDATSGRVRATIKDTTLERYIAGVHVKVIGSGNDRFVSGNADLRGVFVADDIRGKSTVIAQTGDGQYAFYRGSAHLGPVTADPAAQQSQVLPESAEALEGKKASNELMKGLLERNNAIQLDNQMRQQQLYFNDKAGVQIEAVK